MQMELAETSAWVRCTGYEGEPMKYLSAAAMWLIAGTVLLAQQYSISTIAGGGAPPTGVPALGVPVPISGGMAASAAGDVYFASGNAVLKVDTKGILTRFAGTGRYGNSGDGGPATSAALAWPSGLAVDLSGNVYIAENANHRIRRVSPDGAIATVAGTGSPGDAGDGGPAVNAQLHYPVGVAVDTSGNLYIADTGNHRVRKVSGQGVMTTVAADLPHAEGVAVDATGNVYITDFALGEAVCEDCDPPFVGRIVRVTPTGSVDTIAGGGKEPGDNGPATSARLETPRGIAVDAAGTLYVTDSMNDRVRKITRGGVITTAAGISPLYSPPCPYVWGPLEPSPFRCPIGVALDAVGNLYVADTGNYRVRKISPQGEVANIAGSGAPGAFWGDGGQAQDASLSYPLGVAVDASANLYIADTGNSRVRKVSPDGVITTVAGNGIPGYSGDGGPAIGAQLRGPAGLAVDASGNLYIADLTDHRVRKVSPSGIITTVAGNGITGDGFGPWADGGPATRANLAGPRGVAVDAGGNLYIADTHHLSVRKVSADGIITTVLGGGSSANTCGRATRTFTFPTGAAVDAAGQLYVADYCGIRKLSRDGNLSVVAPYTNESDGASPTVALDAPGNIFILGVRIRKVTADGSSAIIDGNGTTGYTGDGGPAVSASFSNPFGIAVNAAGEVYVADAYNHAIRVLRVRTE